LVVFDGRPFSRPNPITPGEAPRQTRNLSFDRAFAWRLILRDFEAYVRLASPPAGPVTDIVTLEIFWKFDSMEGLFPSLVADPRHFDPFQAALWPRSPFFQPQRSCVALPFSDAEIGQLPSFCLKSLPRAAPCLAVEDSFHREGVWG